MRKIYIMLSLLVTVVACKKEGARLEIAPSLDPKLKSIRYYFVDKTFYDVRYAYDAYNRIVKVEQINENGTSIGAEDRYYNGDKLDSILTSDKQSRSKMTYIYRDGKLNSMRYYEYASTSGQFKLYYERLFEYIGSDISKTTDLYIQGGYNTFTVYTHHDQNISETKTYLLATNELIDDTQYEYDDKRNPLYQDRPNKNDYSMLFNNRNNIVLEKYLYRKSQGVGEVKYKYTYNTNDYPVTQSIVGLHDQLIIDQAFSYMTD